LESAHAVWCERFNQSQIQTDLAGKNQHKEILDLYTIGEKCKISPQHVRRSGEPEKARTLKERVMRVAVIRMQKRAEALIANALNTAVESGKWIAPGLSQIDWKTLRQRYYLEDIWLDDIPDA
jgi:lambda repressor-like predicted transcriptional regulator